MRTTLNIADDVFIATKNIARREGTTIGEVLSNIARKMLQSSPANLTSSPPNLTTYKANGNLKKLGLLPYKANKGKTVTNDLVNALRESEDI